MGIEEAVGSVPAGGEEGGEEVGVAPQVAVELVEGGAVGRAQEEVLRELGFVPDAVDFSALCEDGVLLYVTVCHFFAEELESEG